MLFAQRILMAAAIVALTLATAFAEVSATTESAPLKIEQWEGNVFFTNAQPRLLLKLESDINGLLKGTLCLLDQENQELALQNLKTEGDAISFEVGDGRAVARFSGKYSPDRKSITGDLYQAGGSFAFKLEKSDKLTERNGISPIRLSPVIIIASRQNGDSPAVNHEASQSQAPSDIAVHKAGSGKTASNTRIWPILLPPVIVIAPAR